MSDIPDWKHSEAETLPSFNNGQRLLLNQFSELRSALLHEEFSCPIGTDMIIAIVQGCPYSSVTVDNLINRTGAKRPQLEERISCLEEQGVLVRDGETIKFTKKGLVTVNDVADQILGVLMKITDRIREQY